MVFNDRQLPDLITRKPRTVADLQQISGFGPIKAEKYGPGILALLNPLEGAQAAATRAGQKPSWSPSQQFPNRFAQTHRNDDSMI